MNGTVPGVFAYAERFDAAADRYIGLVIESTSNAHIIIDADSVIVQPAIAEQQYQFDKQKREIPSTPNVGPGELSGVIPGVTPPVSPPPVVVDKKPTRFVGSVKISSDRPAHEMRQIVEAIIEQLTTMKGAEVNLRLEIDAEVPDGLDRSKVRTLMENASTLGFSEKMIR